MKCSCSCVLQSICYIILAQDSKEDAVTQKKKKNTENRNQAEFTFFWWEDLKDLNILKGPSSGPKPKRDAIRCDFPKVYCTRISAHSELSSKQEKS